MNVKCFITKCELYSLLSLSVIDCLSSRKGDYCRYMAEYKTAEARDEAADKASTAYEEAQKVATGEYDDKSQLPSTHPIRLG